MRLSTIQIGKQSQKGSSGAISQASSKARGKTSKKLFPLFMLYLSCISTAELSSKDLIASLGRLQHIFGYISVAFRKIDLLINKWGYEQVKACRITAELCNEPLLKGFLVRFAQAISVNTPITEFTRIEYEKYEITLEDEYTRTMDKLKSLSEAYSAILTSSAFISVSMLLSAITFASTAVNALLGVTVLAVAITIIVFIFLLHSNAPSEEVANKLEGRPARLQKLSRLANPAVFVGLMVMVVPHLLYILGVIKFTAILESDSLLKYMFPTPIFLIPPGVVLTVLGWKGNRMIKGIKEIDNEYPLFVKTLGKACSITGSLSTGVSRILHSDFGRLTPVVRRQHHKMKLGVRRDYSLRVMEAETGSELIRQITEIFYDSTNKGGKFAEVSYLCFSFSSSWLAKKKKRAQVAGYLKGLIIPLQITFVSIITMTQGLATLLIGFGKKLGTGAIQIGGVDPEVMTAFFFGILLSLTLGNALAIWVIYGDSRFTFTYYFGFIMLVSGLLIFLVGIATGSLLSGFTKLGELAGAG
ncbi:MAG: hypothetical protein HYU39_06610 [Thaumarchaeota archaeon]|nr:hypothetical protein [Nitrososphaerota archaeon]